MKLILLRHGDRSPGFSDVPLSEKGLEQAEKLTQENLFLSVHKIYCSPKKRAQQTVQPLSLKLKLPVEITSELDQMREIEGPQDFTLRVQKFIDSLPKNSQECWLLCSHSDWLQQIVLHLANLEQMFAPHSFFNCAEYKVFEHEHNEWHFRERI